MSRYYRELKAKLLERQNHRCCWCGHRFTGADVDWRRPTFEHVLPKSRGGEFDEENIVIACKGCNRARGNLPVDAFIAIFDALRVDRRGSTVGSIMTGLHKWHAKRLGEDAWMRVKHAFTAACHVLSKLKRPVPEYEAWLMAYSAVVNCGHGHDHEDPFNNPATDLRSIPVIVPDYETRARRIDPAPGGLLVPCVYCGAQFGLSKGALADGIHHEACASCRKTWHAHGFETVKGVPFLTGTTGKAARLELDTLTNWLLVTFKPKTVDEIQNQYVVYRREAADIAEPPKSWLTFLRDFKESYEALLAEVQAA